MRPGVSSNPVIHDFPACPLPYPSRRVFLLRLNRCLSAGAVLGFGLLLPPFLAPPAAAQTFSAVSLDAGWFSGFAQAYDGRLYGYGDVFGAWRSDDGGKTWNYLNWSIPKNATVGIGMAVQKDDSNVVFSWRGLPLVAVPRP